MLEVNLGLIALAVRCGLSGRILISLPFSTRHSEPYFKAIYAKAYSMPSVTEGAFKAVNQPFRAEMAAIEYGA